jgi:hypothetical protein
MTRCVAVAALAVLALLVPGNTRAKDGKEGRKAVNKIVTLTPDEEAQVVIPNFTRRPMLDSELGSRQSGVETGVARRGRRSQA